MEIPVEEEVVGHLFGEREKSGEDLIDVYRIPNVPAGQTIRVQLVGFGGVDTTNERRERDDSPNASIASIGIQQIREDASGQLALRTVDAKRNETTHAYHIGFSSPRPTLRYRVVETGDYFVSIEHWTGNVRYRLKVHVDYFDPDR